MGYWDERARRDLEMRTPTSGKKEVGRPASWKGAQKLMRNLQGVYGGNPTDISQGQLRKILNKD